MHEIIILYYSRRSPALNTECKSVFSRSQHQAQLVKKPGQP